MCMDEGLGWVGQSLGEFLVFVFCLPTQESKAIYEIPDKKALPKKKLRNHKLADNFIINFTLPSYLYLVASTHNSFLPHPSFAKQSCDKNFERQPQSSSRDLWNVCGVRNKWLIMMNRNCIQNDLWFLPWRLLDVSSIYPDHPRTHRLWMSNDEAGERKHVMYVNNAIII